MHLWGEALTFTTAFFLFLALAMALGFEFVNGFHDTANAVATVIYTKSLKPTYAVVLSGLMNLLGVIVSTGSVAYGVIALLPVDLVLNVGSGAGFAMVFALLLSAIIWNVGTWYFGLPASSSHTLIGSIMGVGIANAMMNGRPFTEGINWAKAIDVGNALLWSPIIGFTLSALLLLILKAVVKWPEFFAAADKDKPTPIGVRALLITTCTFVSFSHGSNDGQKGMGLIMLILIGIVPGAFALKMTTSADTIQKVAIVAHQSSATLQTLAGDTAVSEEDATKDLSQVIKPSGKFQASDLPALLTLNNSVAAKLDECKSFGDISSEDRRVLRTQIYLVGAGIDKAIKAKVISDETAQKALGAYKKQLTPLTQFIPDWVKVVVAMALGFGTMIGWKRIVVTVGEKIGKSHLTYAQGACAELVAAVTIQAATVVALPVSTTHILSSGIAGTMAANRSGLQAATLRNILMAWVLTLPVCIFLGATLFAASLYVVLNVFGLK